MSDTSAFPRFTTALQATILFLAVAASPVFAAWQDPSAICEEVGRLMLGQADADAESCLVTLPRSDISVTLLGTSLPDVAVASRILFTMSAGHTTVLGVLALAPGESTRVLRELRAAGFSLAALHRHMARESPEFTFAHFTGAGEDARDLARSIRQAIGPPARGSPIRGQAIVGERGSVAGIPCFRLAIAAGATEAQAEPGPGYCAITVPINTAVTMNGTRLPARSFVHQFGFRQTPDRTSAVVTATLVVPAVSAANVLAAVAGGGFDVVTMANDLLDEQPRMVTLHAQGRGNPLLLAETLLQAVSQPPGGGDSSGTGGPVAPRR